MNKDYRTLWYQFKQNIFDRPSALVNKDMVLGIMAKMECDLYLNQDKAETPPPEPEPPIVRRYMTLQYVLRSIKKMNLKVLASSSKGNSYILQSPTGACLLKRGIPWKNITRLEL